MENKKSVRRPQQKRSIQMKETILEVSKSLFCENGFTIQLQMKLRKPPVYLLEVYTLISLIKTLYSQNCWSAATNTTFQMCLKSCALNQVRSFI